MNLLAILFLILLYGITHIFANTYNTAMNIFVYYIAYIVVILLK